MVKAIIDISKHTNRVLNIVKAKYDLRNKSKAINIMAEEYEEVVLEPELKPEYVKKASKIQKQPSIKIGSVEKLRKRHEK